MVPFLTDALENQMRKLMKIFVTREALNEANNKWSLVNFDLTKKENLQPQYEPKIGTALKHMVGELEIRPEMKRMQPCGDSSSEVA